MTFVAGDAAAIDALRQRSTSRSIQQPRTTTGIALTLHGLSAAVTEYDPQFTPSADFVARRPGFNAANIEPDDLFCSLFQVWVADWPPRAAELFISVASASNLFAAMMSMVQLRRLAACVSRLTSAITHALAAISVK